MNAAAPKPTTEGTDQLYRVKWRSPVTGAVGQGNTLPRSDAEDAVYFGILAYPEIHHWIEHVTNG